MLLKQRSTDKKRPHYSFEFQRWNTIPKNRYFCINSSVNLIRFSEQLWNSLSDAYPWIFCILRPISKTYLYFALCTEKHSLYVAYYFGKIFVFSVKCTFRKIQISHQNSTQNTNCVFQHTTQNTNEFWKLVAKYKFSLFAKYKSSLQKDRKIQISQWSQITNTTHNTISPF